MKMRPEISVVIPCFNSGEFLREAIASVQCDSIGAKCEVIVVNDGSTDKPTLSLLNEFSREGIMVIDQENRGPAAARNTGVDRATSEYVLFLDSDNRVYPSYVNKALAILNANHKVGVVYGNPNFIGSHERNLFRPGRFSLIKMLAENYIDMCAVVRREAWASASGLDENRLLIGHEDWEFWIHLGALGWQFHHIDEPLFDYRLRPDSLITTVTDRATMDMKINYVFSKHISVVRDCYQQLYKQFNIYQYDRNNPLRSFIKYVFYKVRPSRRKSSNLG